MTETTGLTGIVMILVELAEHVRTAKADGDPIYLEIDGNLFPLRGVSVRREATGKQIVVLHDEPAFPDEPKTDA